MKTIDDEICWVRKWTDNQFESISKLNNSVYRHILMFAVIDAIVQHQESLSGKNQKDFATFLIKYSTMYNAILQSYCPTTMFYDNESLLTYESLHLEMPTIYFVNEPDVINESNRILNLLSVKNGAKTERHKYAWLIYAMRNKLVHEMTIVGCEASFLSEGSDPIPHLVVLDKYDKSEISHYKWTLMIPEEFIVAVGKSAIQNYLDECEKLRKHPLSNMEQFRKCRFSWYD